MEQLTFDMWWKDFLTNTPAREDHYHTLERLLTFVDGLLPPKRDVFVTGLADIACDRRDGWNIAVAALEKSANRDALQRLRDIATALPEVRRHTRSGTTADPYSGFSPPTRRASSSPQSMCIAASRLA